MSQSVEVVTVDFLDSKSEGPPFLCKGLQVLNNQSAVIGLLLIVVDNDRQIGKLVFPRAKSGFPNGSFVGFPVSYDHKNAVSRFVQLGAQCKANADGQSVSQAAR